MKNNLSKMNFLLLIFMIIYSIFGLVMILSSSSVAAVLRYEVSPNYFFMKQLVIGVIAYIIGIIILFIPTKSRIYKLFSKLIIYVVIGLLVFLFFTGIVAGGAQSWYDFGVANFQPTEFAKLALIMYFAVYYYQLSKRKKISFINMIYPLLLAGAMIFLVALQPDFGGAAIIFFIASLIFIGLPIGKEHKKMVYKIIGVGAIVLGLAFILLGKTVLKSYQVSRILNYQNPCQRYAEETGYQVCNGYIAINNGGLFGVGLGNSTQKYLYLPEAHTDFIFPIICEELGIIVGIVVIIGYFILLLIILDTAKKTDNLKNSIICYGVFAFLFAHILINTLGVLGLIPLTGVPLPFLSYGNSFNVVVIVSLFLVLRISIENKIAMERKKIEEL